MRINRRQLLDLGCLMMLPSGVLLAMSGCEKSKTDVAVKRNLNQTDDEVSSPMNEVMLQLHYLEIVTAEVEAVCQQYSDCCGVSFGQPVANLGGAKIAKLQGGGMIGVRGPLRDNEAPVIRPYMLVEDIAAAVETATKAGAELALPPMELPGYGTCAIVIQGGIECGFWQV